MSRSSTSSSEGHYPPHRVVPLNPVGRRLIRSRVPMGLVGAVAILLGVEIGARSPAVWYAEPQSQTGVIRALERGVIEPSGSPRVIVLGSSRIRDALIPARAERALGLQRGSVLNLGMTAGTAFDSLLLYSRNRDKLGGASVLVLAAEDWYYNAGIPPTERDLILAPLPHRVGVLNTRSTMRLLVAWAWRSYGAKDAMLRAARAWITNKPRSLPISDDGRLQWRDKDEDYGPDEYDARTDVDKFYKDYEPTLGRHGQMEKLIAMARRDGMRVIVVRVPLREGYLQAAQERYPEHEPFMERHLRALDADKVRIYSDGSSIGITPNMFYDYGHLADVGSQRMTDEIVRILREHAPGIARQNTGSP